jgi:hypothetical protein
VVVERHTLLARSSPYSKQWFTPELKMQPKEVNRIRRRWQNSCANKGREDATMKDLFIEMHNKRRAWT